MKKIVTLTLGLFVMLTAITACGGGASEADDKAKQDSIRNDSIQRAMEEQRRADSIQAHLDSLQAANDSLSNVEPKTIYIDNTPKDGGDDGSGEETPVTEPTPEDKPATTKGGRDRDGVKGTDGKTGRDRAGTTTKTEGGTDANTKSGRSRGR